MFWDLVGRDTGYAGVDDFGVGFDHGLVADAKFVHRSRTKVFDAREGSA